MICYDDNPALYEVLAVLLSNVGKYVEFRYRRLPELQKPKTPSRILAEQDTECPENREELTLVRGFIDTQSGGLRMTKDGNFILTMRNICRKKKLPTGVGYYRDKRNKKNARLSKIGFDQKEYLYRSYRLDRRDDGKGMDLATMVVAAAKRGKVRVFPNVANLPPQVVGQI